MFWGGVSARPSPVLGAHLGAEVSGLPLHAGTAGLPLQGRVGWGAIIGVLHPPPPSHNPSPTPQPPLMLPIPKFHRDADTHHGSRTASVPHGSRGAPQGQLGGGEKQRGGVIPHLGGGYGGKTGGGGTGCRMQPLGIPRFSIGGVRAAPIRGS